MAPDPYKRFGLPLRMVEDVDIIRHILEQSRKTGTVAAYLRGLVVADMEKQPTMKDLERKLDTVLEKVRNARGPFIEEVSVSESPEAVNGLDVMLDKFRERRR